MQMHIIVKNHGSLQDKAAIRAQTEPTIQRGFADGRKHRNGIELRRWIPADRIAAAEF
jgi:hypothetical protein